MVAIRGDMGWSSFKERMLKGKMILKKIEKLIDDRWLKKRLQESGKRSLWRKEIKRWKR